MTHKNDFHFIGNNLALDFLNTLIHVGGEPVELLKDANALKLWLQTTGFNINENVSKKDVQRAIKLRQAIHVLIQSATNYSSQDKENALGCINSYIARPIVPAQLIYADESYMFEQTSKPDIAIDCLKDIAMDAARLLTETQPKHIRACADEKCILVFKDVSRSQRRKWCRMETCGNRAKVALHYKRSQVDSSIETSV